MGSRLNGPDRKVERANKHIAELVDVVDRFLHTEPYPYGLVPDIESEPGRRLYRVRVWASPPEEVAVILGDALYGLRSALDLLAWQCVEAGGGTPNDSTGFPISDDKRSFERKGLKKVFGASQDALDLIAAAQPYRGGNDRLWQLHHLNRFDKHRLLPIVGAAFREFSLDFAPEARREWAKVSDKPLPDIRVGFKNADPIFPLKEGDVLFSDDGKSELNPIFAFAVAIGQSGYSEGEPILTMASEIAQQVQAILDSFRPLLG